MYHDNISNQVVVLFLWLGSECEDGSASPPLELCRATDSPAVATLYVPRHLYYDGPPPAHRPSQPRLQVATPPHASQVPPQADSLLILLQVCFDVCDNMFVKSCILLCHQMWWPSTAVACILLFRWPSKEVESNLIINLISQCGNAVPIGQWPSTLTNFGARQPFCHCQRWIMRCAPSEYYRKVTQFLTLYCGGISLGDDHWP